MAENSYVRIARRNRIVLLERVALCRPQRLSRSRLPVVTTMPRSGRTSGRRVRFVATRNPSDEYRAKECLARATQHRRDDCEFNGARFECARGYLKADQAISGCELTSIRSQGPGPNRSWRCIVRTGCKRARRHTYRPASRQPWAP